MMNRILRITALLMSLCCSCLICQAQQNHKAYFTYDLDGNRIIRGLFFGKMEGDKNGNESVELLSYATDLFETTEVSLYPNPTCDKFFVETKSNSSKKAEVELAYITGAVIERRVLNGSKESFDLTGRASGVYLLKLTVDNETHTWKVIKKQ